MVLAHGDHFVSRLEDRLTARHNKIVSATEMHQASPRGEAQVGEALTDGQRASIHRKTKERQATIGNGFEFERTRDHHDGDEFV